MVFILNKKSAMYVKRDRSIATSNSENLQDIKFLGFVQISFCKYCHHVTIILILFFYDFMIVLNMCAIISSNFKVIQVCLVRHFDTRKLN